MITMNVGALVAAMGIPSALIAFLFWNLERKIQARDKAEDEKRKRKEEEEKERDEQRQTFEVQLLQSINAAIALSEATARAVQRIPDAHCNGDMHEALEYATKVKHEQKDFLTARAVDALNN